jgi:aspartyl-tRNA(Asn)/glutamyl-tRNA(Gln) amidotransferase subunit A
MTDFWRKPLDQLSRDLAAGATTSLELVRGFQERSRRFHPVLNALDTENAEALNEAAESDRRRQAGKVLGPLDGIPIAVKDNILTRGLRTTWGSPVYSDCLPETDETPVERLKAAGMIVLGKTNVPEFTLEGFTSNPLFGTTPNPWNLAVTPGGSSGGSVAGVAAGIFPAALGTDGGGSIRRPCGYTGLFGLKPTIGRIARAQTLPQVLLDMEVVGPITRDVTSSAMLFSAMEGTHAADPRSRLPEEPDRHVALDTGPPPLRILYVERLGDAPLDPEIAGSTRAFAERLQALGHHVSQGPMPFDLSGLNAGWTRIGQAGLGFLARTLGSRFEAASPKYREIADASRQVGSDELFDILDGIARLREEAAGFFETCDVILTPASAAMPWPVGSDFPPEIDGRPVGPRGHAVYTGWVNAIGHPAIALPASPSANGLPIGVQLVGAHNRDWLLLRLARQYEKSHSWHASWPPVGEGI